MTREAGGSKKVSAVRRWSAALATAGSGAQKDRGRRVAATAWSTSSRPRSRESTPGYAAARIATSFGCGSSSRLVTQLPWPHHLTLLGRTKHPEEHEFYMLAAIEGRWTKRELERQIRTGGALRSDISAEKVSPAVAQTHPTAIEEFKNAYNFKFLTLPDGHSEADLHGALLRNLGRFITDLGRDLRHAAASSGQQKPKACKATGREDPKR